MDKRSVLITGAFGGMGRATAERLAGEGFRVFALDKSVSAMTNGVIPICADITDENSVISAVERIKEETESLFAVIHFAGIYMLDSLVEMDTEDFDKITDINLRGAFLVNKAVISLLGEGSRIIITTSELAPLDPLPFTGIYAVTKAALDKYAYSLRMELQLKGIEVSVLRAGAVSTGMLGASTDALDRFCNRTKLYTCNADRFKAIVNGVEARSVIPQRVADKIFKILKKRRPAFAYNLNRNPLLLMLNSLPKTLQLWIIKQILK